MKNQKRFASVLAGSLAVSAVVGCTAAQTLYGSGLVIGNPASSVAGSEALSTESTAPATTEPSPLLTLSVNLGNLPPLAEGAYEGWAVYSVSGKETWISLGQFQAGPDGAAQVPTLTSPQDLRGATRFVLTVEPAGDADGIPSKTRVLSGDFVGDSAYLAFPLDFSMSSGRYALVTPSDDDSTNHHQGIRFMSLGEGGGSGGGNGQPGSNMQPGLNLPDPSVAGWRYAGWVLDESTPSEPVFYPTGRFTSAWGHDDDKSGATGGSKDGPAAPGQDFVKGTVLTLNSGSYAAAVTLEADTPGVRFATPATGSMTLLYDRIPQGAWGRPSLGLRTLSFTQPTGSVKRQ